MDFRESVAQEKEGRNSLGDVWRKTVARLDKLLAKTAEKARGRVMSNLRMREKLDLGECLDVNKIGRPDGPGVFVLSRYIDGIDYCDAATDQWIWSIGRDVDTGEIVAATDTRFYQHPQYECLWLR